MLEHFYEPMNSLHSLLWIILFIRKTIIESSSSYKKTTNTYHEMWLNRWPDKIIRTLQCLENFNKFKTPTTNHMYGPHFLLCSVLSSHETQMLKFYTQKRTQDTTMTNSSFHESSFWIIKTHLRLELFQTIRTSSTKSHPQTVGWSTVLTWPRINLHQYFFLQFKINFQTSEVLLIPLFLFIKV